MSLVIHVSAPDRQGRIYTYPFEVDKSYYFDTHNQVQDWLNSGKSVMGKRLWLDRPVPSIFYGMAPPDPELNIPDKVRVVLSESSWVLHFDRMIQVLPWVSGRVVRFED